MRMPQRVSPPAEPGTLLKRHSGTRRKPTSGRAPRERDEAHLEAIRQCPCLACGIDPAGEAAHIRMTRPGKPNAGVGRKPDDRWAVPLCRDCHRDGPTAQHRVGEEAFWIVTGLNPVRIAESLHRVSPSVEAMRAVVFAAHSIGGTDGQ